MKTDWSPKRLRKYQERLDTQRTSRSRVMTPDWSIDLNRMVSGKGNFTAKLMELISIFTEISVVTGPRPWSRWELDRLGMGIARTDHKSCKESIDPSHYQRLRDHHRHIALHHTHHALHSRRVRHRVPCRLTPILWFLQECALLEVRNQIFPPGIECRTGNSRVVIAKVDAAEEGALLADAAGIKLLWSSGE